MAQQINLAGLWDSIAQSAENDRDQINQLDTSNQNAGDNYAANMQLVAKTLDRELQGGRGDAGVALAAAAEQLRRNGRGSSAAIYASGLSGAAEQFRGRSGLDVTDLLPLLQGFMSGAQGNSSALPQGQGGILDALIPGVLGYLSAKQQGLSDTDALIAALSAAQGGGSPALPGIGGSNALPLPGLGGGASPANPGAAGVGSLLQGLLQGMLSQGGARSTQQEPQRPRPNRGDSVEM